MKKKTYFTVILAVLGIIALACGFQRATHSKEFFAVSSYKIDAPGIIFGGTAGQVNKCLADRIKISVKPELSGTYVEIISANNLLALDSGSDATLFVRTAEQKQLWEQCLNEIKASYDSRIAPRDVLPTCITGQKPPPNIAANKLVFNEGGIRYVNYDSQ